MGDGKKDTALGLGERLRSARKARALTLEQAAFSIRLDVSVLRALEDENFEALGAAVFVRGHLKAYARLLGLSEEAVMTAYRSADPKADAPPKVTRELERPLTTTPGPVTVAVALVIALVAMLILYLLSSGEPPPGETTTVPGPDLSSTVETGPTPDFAPGVTETSGVDTTVDSGQPPAPTETAAVPAEVAPPAATPAPLADFE